MSSAVLSASLSLLNPGMIGTLIVACLSVTHRFSIVKCCSIIDDTRVYEEYVSESKDLTSTIQ